MKRIISLLLPLFVLGTSLGLVSCATRELGRAPNGPTNPLVSESDYAAMLDKQTQRQKLYDGFAEMLEYHATFLNTALTLAQVDQNAQIYQYSDAQYQNEKGTAQSNLAKQSEFFMSLYVAETKYDDLAKKTTKWKVFLDVAGQRYEARIVRIKAQLNDIQSLYPFHNRFATAYKLIFPVATSVTENGNCKLTLTGPMTSFSIQYP